MATHPIQYYAPWFRYIAEHTRLSLRVFYLWDFGVTQRHDRGFGQSLQWDVPLLSGYDYEFVENTSRDPGTHRFFGLRNPALIARLHAFDPSAVLVLGYNFASLIDLIVRWPRERAPLIFRGDSHRLRKRHGPRERLRRVAIAQAFRRFAAFLYVGIANRAYFEYHGVKAGKLFRAPHAVDNARFMAAADDAERAAVLWRSELGIPDGDAVVLFAGKFEEEKRPLDLLRAFLGLGLARVSLLMVGAGALEAEMRREAAGHPKVFFAGFQNQTLMPRTYCAGDVLVLPSVSETWGLAVNEAMCMGRPVIVSDQTGCAQDLVEPGQSGLVFRAGDLAALGDALATALSDRGELRRWGARGREIVGDYDFAHATAGLLEALAALRVG